MKLIILIIILITIFTGCTGSSENPDAEEKESSCGNGVVEEWEACDFTGTLSCTEYSPEAIGPLKCESCKVEGSECIEKSLCDIAKCNGNGNCIESSRYDHLLYCECFKGHMGYDCSVCMEGYHLENGRCKGANCFFTNLKCTEFEKCDDSSGKPVCICAGANQDTSDCSKCLSGYEWVQQECTDKAWVMCKTDPARPENSSDITESVLITYTEEAGWSKPEYCEWECVDGTFFNEGNCQEIEIFYSDDLEIPFGFDNSGRLVAGNKEGDVLILSSTEIIERTSYGIQFTNGRIGADGNIYFRMLSGYGVLNYETGSYFIFQKEIMRNPITLSKDGTVFFGDTYFDFPDLIPVSLDFQNRYAVTITDQEGNTLTVYQDGYVIFLDVDKKLRWSKQFDDYNFTAFPAINKAGLAFLPCYIKSQHGTSGLIIDLNNGESIKAPELYSGVDLKHAPAISIDSDYRKFVSDSGVLKVYDSDNKFLYDTSSISPYRLYAENIPPVISNEGLIYFANDHHILAFRESDKRIWSFDINIDAIPRTLIHKDEKLYVFTSKGELHILYAPGEAAGKWPQMLHDSELSGSIAYTPEFKRPAAPSLVFPDNSAVLDTDPITFSWQTYSGDPEIKYTLLLRDSTGYDKVFAGPEKALSTAMIEGLTAGTYEWRVVSKDSNGSLNVSDARTFTIQ